MEAGQATVTSPAPLLSAAPAHSAAAPAMPTAAGDHQHVAALALVGVARVLGHEVLRGVKKVVAARGVEKFPPRLRGADVDVGRAHFAADVQTIVEVVAGLGVAQGEGHVGIHANAGVFRIIVRRGKAAPGEAGKAGGDVHGDDLRAVAEAVLIHAADERGGVARRGAGKAGAKERVHPHVRALAAVNGEFAHAGLAGAAQAFDGVRAFRLLRKHEGHVRAARLEQARRRQAVAAVAAGAAGEEDGAKVAEAFHEQGGERRSRLLHHLNGRNAGLGEIELFHFAHLFRGQNERAQCHAITSHISVQAAHGNVAGQHGFRFAVHLPDQRAVLAEVQRLALAAIYAYPLPSVAERGRMPSRMGDKAAFLPNGVPRLEAFKKYRKKFLGRDARAGLKEKGGGVGKLLGKTRLQRLTPAPRTSQSHFPSRNPVSASMPHIFLPPMTRSLGHLIFAVP